MTSRWPIVLLAATTLVRPTFAEGPPARGDGRPPLGTLVRQSDLIVLCRIEVKEGMVRRRVVETWKGTYAPESFLRPPVAGYLYRDSPETSSHIAPPRDGRQVIYFFRRDKEGKFDRHDDWFVVVRGNVMYDGVYNLRKHPKAIEDRIVYPLEEFKAEIVAAVRRMK